MRRLLPALVVLLVLTAGCSGLLPGGSNDTPADGPTVDGTEVNGTNGSVDGAAVKADALAAMDAVETYRVEANVTTQYVGALDQTVAGTSEGRFNRTAREAYLTQTQAVLNRSYVVETYYVNDTLYQHSESYTLRFDSEWIRYPTPVNASVQWSQFDTLARQRAVLNASNVTLAGTETINGTETYVLRANVDRSRLSELGYTVGGAGRGDLNVTSLNATYYISTETARPVRTVTTLTGQTTVRAQDNGRTLRIKQRIALDFGGYGEPVTVTLPDGASTAATIGNASANATGTPA